jgi:hypothetical protein
MGCDTIVVESDGLKGQRNVVLFVHCSSRAPDASAGLDWRTANDDDGQCIFAIALP